MSDPPPPPSDSPPTLLPDLVTNSPTQDSSGAFVAVAVSNVANSTAIANPVAVSATNPVATTVDPDPYEDSSGCELDLPRRGFLCWCRETEDERLEHVLTTTALTRMQKNSIRRRFFELLREFRLRCRLYSILFHVGHFTITVGSLVVPALLSVQYAGTGITFIDASSFQAQIYWATWILSLLVTMFNGVLVLFKVDVKYYSLHTTLERLRSEGWQYLQLTGRYAGGFINGTEMPTHRNQFKYFCHYIEKIKLKQVEEEYYKYEDSKKNTTVTGNAAAATGATAAAVQPTATAGSTATAAQPTATPFYPPSLQNNIASLADQAPPSVQDAIRGLVRVQPTATRANETISPSSKAVNAISTLPMQSPLRQSTT
jgi:hypothetical protein